MECKTRHCENEVNSNDFLSQKWKLCDDCQSAEEDHADSIRDEKLIDRLEKDD